MNKLKIILSGIVKNNPTFVLVLGMCPTLGTTTSAENGMGMGLATMAVLIMSNLVISLVKNIIPDKVRIPAFIVIIASFVTIIEMLMKAFVPALYASLGVFIPLIVVNCIILGRAEAFSYKNGVGASFFDGIFQGIGYTVVLLIMCISREFLGAGTFGGGILNGGEGIRIIAKIENRSGVDHVEEICEIANGIMIARGDLGVEIPGVEVPAIQKYLINKCRMLGTRVITATEMLESMIHNPRPTRAELSDVANAVYDGSSAIMLSGESAAGKYPVEAVKNMAETAEYTEKQINYGKRFANADFQTKSIVDAISHATCAMAIDVDAKCIVVSSLTGRTVRMVSRFRCPVDIIGMTTSEKAWRKLNLSWGVKPVLCEEYNSMEVMFYNAMNEAKSVMKLKKGDHIVLTGGLINGKTGNTNVIKVETV